MQTGARVRRPPVCRVSMKRIEDFQSTELFQNQVFDFLSVLGVVLFCKWGRYLRKFSNSSTVVFSKKWDAVFKLFTIVRIFLIPLPIVFSNPKF